MRGRLRSQPARAAVDHVALGPDDYWFLQFQDGTIRSNGPDSLRDALRARGPGVTVELLAFAPDDGWFMQYDDGTTDWEGLPLRLHNQIHGRRASMPRGSAAAAIEHLAIGPNSEWFVRYANGSCVNRNLGFEMKRTMNKLRSQGHRIGSVAFGENYTWAIMY